MVTLRTLAFRYVAQRRARDEINKRTAEQLTSRLLSFTQVVKVPPDRVKRRHVERWMEAPGLSAHYRRGRLSALRGFCQWCVLNGHMTLDPTIGVRLPEVPQGLPRARRHDEIVKVLDHCPDLRTKLCALLMVQEGLRRAEVAAANMSDLCLRSLTLGVRGKGGRGLVTRTVPVSGETARVAGAYIAQVGHGIGPLIRSEMHPDRGLSPQRVGELVTKAMWDAGIKQANGDGCSAHALRHSAAHEMLEQGADVLEVKAHLGHRSINSTMIYLRGHVPANLRAAAGGRSYLR